MDYSKQIFQMLGVEPKEEFRLTKRNKEIKFRLTKYLSLEQYEEDTKEWRPSLLSLTEILNDSSSIVKIAKPTEKEQLAIDYARSCGYNWLAKDKNGDIFAYKKKPSKYFKEMRWKKAEFDTAYAPIILIPISFISFTDEEPFYIGGE